MADSSHACATPAFPPHTHDTLTEVDADLCDANDAMQALMALLRGCEPEQPIPAGHLRGLLQPIAGMVQQAATAMAVVFH